MYVKYKLVVRAVQLEAYQVVVPVVKCEIVKDERLWHVVPLDRDIFAVRKTFPVGIGWQVQVCLLWGRS